MKLKYAIELPEWIPGNNFNFWVHGLAQPQYQNDMWITFSFQSRKSKVIYIEQLEIVIYFASKHNPHIIQSVSNKIHTQADSSLVYAI